MSQYKLCANTNCKRRVASTECNFCRVCIIDGDVATTDMNNSEISILSCSGGVLPSTREQYLMQRGMARNGRVIKKELPE